MPDIQNKTSNLSYLKTSEQGNISMLINSRKLPEYRWKYFDENCKKMSPAYKKTFWSVFTCSLNT